MISACEEEINAVNLRTLLERLESIDVAPHIQRA